MFFGMNRGFNGCDKGCDHKGYEHKDNDCCCLLLLIMLLGGCGCGNIIGDNCDCIWNILLLIMILNCCGCNC